MSRQISHYPITDLAYSRCFDEAMEAIDGRDFSNLSLIDIFELYPIVNYEKDLTQLNDKGKDEYLGRRAKIEILNKALNQYFGSFNNCTFIADIEELNATDSILVLNYIDAFNKYSKKTRITGDAFMTILRKNYIPLYTILEKENLCKTFKQSIKDYMVESPSSITCFVTEYDEKHRFGHKPYFIPIKMFSDEEIESMIEAYIKSEFANLNIINCLMNHKNGEGNYNITPAMRLKIQNKYKVLQEKLFADGRITSENYEIRIDPSQDEPYIFKQNGNVKIISYSGKWIDGNLDSKPTLLNNLIYIFDLVDNNLRFACLPASNSGCGLADALDNRQKDEYGDFSFKTLDWLGDTTFCVYYQYLFNKGIHLESIFEWFVNEYIKQEFGVHGFEIAIPFEGSYNLRCKNIFSEIDKLLKSYMVLQKYGSIDPAMFSMETLCKYKDLKSLCGKKYIYLSENGVVGRVCHLLFSDQSMLNYVSREKEANSFAELIKSYSLNISEYGEFSKRNLTFLKDNGIIHLSNDGTIDIKDFALAKILEELYFRGFLDINHLADFYEKALETLVSKEWIVDDDSLFSKQESDYLNYCLNSSVFTNSLKLRNIYEHTGKLGAGENELYSDYLKGLKIFALVAIKINDELCKLYPEKK